MFAIVSTGGKQYKVAEETILTVNKLEGSNGDKVTLEEVLFASDGKNFALGNPQIDGAKVNAEIVKQDRDRKILVFIKKRRKNYRRLKGHRQDITFLKINSLDIPGFTNTKKAEKAPKEVEKKAKTVNEKPSVTKKKKTVKKKAVKKD